MFKFKNIALALLGLVIISAIGFFAVSKWHNTAETLSPKRGRVVESIYGLGTVTAEKVFSAKVGVPLTVRKCLVREGDIIKIGDALIQLDSNTVRSPISGTVTAVAFKDGELVPPNTPIVIVTNLNDLHLEVNLEQKSILRVKKAQKAAISFESLRSEKVEGEINSVYPRDNQFIVRIDSTKWPVGLLPGMTADVAIQVGEKEDVLLIPVNALSAGQVIRIRAGRREKVTVQLGVVDGEWAEVLSNNIAPDDRLMSRR